MTVEAYRVGVSLVSLGPGIGDDIARLIKQFQELDALVNSVNKTMRGMGGFSGAMGAGAAAATSMQQAAAGMAAIMPNVAQQAQATATAMERAAAAGRMLALPAPNYARTEFPRGSQYAGPQTGFTMGSGSGPTFQGQYPPNWGTGGPVGGGLGPVGPGNGPTLNVPPGYTMPPPGYPPMPTQGAPALQPGAGGKLLKGGLVYEFTVGVVRDVLGILNAPFEQYEKLNTELTRLRMAGVSDADVNSLEEQIKRVARAVPGRTYGEVAADTIAVRAILGEESGPDKMAAIRMALPGVEKAAALLKAATGETSPEALARLFKAVEVRGDVTDPATHQLSPERFAAGLDAALNVLVLGHGLASTNDLYNATKQGGPAMRAITDPYEAWASVVTPTFELGGSRTGTGLTAAFRALLGGSMAKHFADEMHDLGLAKPEAQYTQLMPAAGRNGAVMYGKDFLVDEDVLVNQGLRAWIETTVRDRLAAHGITSAQDINKETYRVMNTETYRRLAAIYLTQSAQVGRDILLYKQIPGLDAKLGLLQGSGMALAGENLGAAFDNTLSGVGETFSGVKMAGMRAATWMLGGNSGITVPWYMSPNPGDWFGGQSRVTPWWARPPSLDEGHGSAAPIGIGPQTLRLDPTQQLHVIVDNGRDLAAGTMRFAAVQGELPQAGPTGPDIRVSIPQPGFTPGWP
jgi:hypothetical protein